MAKLDPQTYDEDRACLGAALTACALGLKPETMLSPGPSAAAARAWRC